MLNGPRFVNTTAVYWNAARAGKDTSHRATARADRDVLPHRTELLTALESCGPSGPQKHMFRYVREGVFGNSCSDQLLVWETEAWA